MQTGKACTNKIVPDRQSDSGLCVFFIQQFIYYNLDRLFLIIKEYSIHYFKKILIKELKKIIKELSLLSRLHRQDRVTFIDKESFCC